MDKTRRTREAIEKVTTSIDNVVSPLMLLEVAARTMRDQQVTELVVIQDGDVRGIVTEHDFVNAVAAGRDVAHARVIDIYSAINSVDLASEDLMSRFANLKADRADQRIAVCREGRPIGTMLLADLEIEGASPGEVDANAVEMAGSAQPRLRSATPERLEDQVVASWILAPVEGDLKRIRMILDLLDEETDAVVRADLGTELVRSCALCEDACVRALYHDLEQFGFTDAVHQLRASTQSLREAMIRVYRIVHHQAPMNVARSEDGSDFEGELTDLVQAVKEHLELWATRMFPLFDSLSETAQRQLHDQLYWDRRHAVSHPAPPRTTFGRFVAGVTARLDHLDTATLFRPGLERLMEKEESEHARRDIAS